MLNRFRGPSFEEHQIEDEEGTLIGTLRIKPTGILWKKRDARKFKAVTLDVFAAWITETGKDLQQ